MIVFSQYPLLDIKMIYNITMFPHTPDTPPQFKSSAKHLKEKETGWGFVNLFRVDEAIEAEKKFQEEQRLIEYVPAESRPAYIPFKIKGRLTIRFIDDATWEKYEVDMNTNPSKYLYLTNNKGIYPNPPAERLSLERCMERMLEQVEKDQV
jgi:hypothetical protein